MKRGTSSIVFVLAAGGLVACASAGESSDSNEAVDTTEAADTTARNTLEVGFYLTDHDESSAAPDPVAFGPDKPSRQQAYVREYVNGTAPYCGQHGYLPFEGWTIPDHELFVTAGAVGTACCTPEAKTGGLHCGSNFSQAFGTQVLVLSPHCFVFNSVGLHLPATILSSALYHQDGFACDGARIASASPAPASGSGVGSTHPVCWQDCSRPSPLFSSPLVLNFAGGPIAFAGHPVPFDWYGDGKAPFTDWVGRRSGLLALDLDGNGKIQKGAELFGEQTRLPSGALASDGFRALAQYDSDNNGVIDKNDPIFQKLRVWFDGNENGIDDLGLETTSLSSLQITSLSLGASIVNSNTSPTGPYVGLASTFHYTLGGGPGTGPVTSIAATFSDVYLPVAGGGVVR